MRTKRIPLRIDADMAIEYDFWSRIMILFGYKTLISYCPILTLDVDDEGEVIEVDTSEVSRGITLTKKKNLLEHRGIITERPKRRHGLKSNRI